jgi:hypothetical protein
MNAEAKKEDAVLPHHFISLAIAATGKSNQEIAEEIGIPRGNVIAMIRTGSMKLPINRVSAMAKAIDVDPITLLRKVMSQGEAEILKSIEEITGSRAVSANEFGLVQFVRHHSNNLDIAWSSRPEFAEALLESIERIKTRESREAVRQLSNLHAEDKRYAAVKTTRKRA